MSKNAENIMMGVAGAVLAYALWRNFGGASSAAAGGTFRQASAINPVDGVAYDKNNPGQFIPLSMYIPGVVADYNDGGLQTEEFTLVGLTRSVLSDYYNTNAGRSVVRAPGGFW